MGVAAWNALAEQRERSSFVENGPVPTVYISGVAYCDLIDGLLHIVYFSKHPGALGVENVLRLEVVMPALEITTARSLVNEALGKGMTMLHG